MAFDAGTIIARLDLDEQDFHRKLKRAQDAADRFERDPIQLKIGEIADQKQIARARKAFADLDSQISRDAAQRARSSATGSVLGGLAALARGGSGGSGGSGGGRSSGGNQGWGSGLFKGIGPGILGIGTRGALIAGGVGLGAAALPALAGGIAPLGVGLAGLGVATGIGKAVISPISPLLSKQQQAQQALSLATTPQQTQAAQQQLAGINQALAKQPAALQSIFHSISSLQAWWHKFTATLAPALVKPLQVASSVIRGLAGPIRQVFSGAMTVVTPFIRGIGDLAHQVLPLLGRAFRASAPLIRPLLDGLGRFVAGILPGLITLMRAARPAVAAVASVLASLGKGIGGLLSSLAPAIRASAVVFRAIGSVVAALLPIIGKLAGIFAKALAPVIVDLARVLKALTPFLVIVGRVFTSLAGAILMDLVAAFGALAKLLIAISPAIKIFANALSQTFTILENSGVFASLGSALEQIVPALARLINLMARQLAPVLPQLITLISQLSTILITLLATGLNTILTGVIALLTHFPILTKLILAAAVAWGILAIAEAATGIGLIIIAIVAVVGALTLLIKHWSTVWGAVKSVAADVWHFIWDGFGKFLLPLLGPVGLIALGVIELAKHWKRIWGDIKAAASNLWQWLWNDFGAKIKNFFTQTIPGWWRSFIGFTKRDLWNPLKSGFTDLVNWVHDHVTQPIIRTFTTTLPDAFRSAVKIIGNVWTSIQNAVRKPAAWVVDHVINGLISAFDWISGKVGGPHIKQVHPFGLQRGGRLPGYGGGDVLPALLEPGETVVSKDDSRHPAMLAAFKAVGVPGYQGGGHTGQSAIQARVGPAADPSRFHGTTASIFTKTADIAKAVAAVATGNKTALTNAISGLIPHGTGGAVADMSKLLADIPARLLTDAVHTLLGFGGGGLGGRGADVARYAMSWAGRIPYVWGGTALPGGADCSGFVQSVYRHFGITAPRTSEGQGAWVKRGTPQTGGLALYNSPAGGPPPGHVAIVGFKGNVISQGGGLGPQIVPLRSMPYMFAGVPPGHGGLGSVGPGDLRGLERLWRGAGGPGGGIAHIAAAIAMAESGGRSVKQQGQPPGLTGWGPWQITPTSGIRQNGMFGNLLNVANNARAAVWLWRHAGSSFRPWATFNDGAYRSFMDSGGWLKQGTSLIEKRTSQPEAVLNPGQTQAFLALASAVHENSKAWPGTAGLEGRLERLIRAVERNAGQTGAAVGDALNGSTRSASYRARYDTRGA